MTVNEEMKAWQQDFYQGIFNPTEDNIQQACLNICSTDVLSAEARLSIYRGSILGGMTTALSGIYPVCEKLVGQQYFIQMVAGYLREFPSDSPDIGNYGDTLADYLRDFISKQATAQELIYLPDTARLEWLWHKAFNAIEIHQQEKECRPLTELADIEAEDQGRIRFYLDASLGLMQSTYPVDKIWQANQNQSPEQEHGKEQESISLDDGAVYLVVRRAADYGMSIEAITVDVFQFLTAIDQRQCFADIAELDFDTPLADLLSYSMQSGLIVGFDLIEK